MKMKALIFSSCLAVAFTTSTGMLAQENGLPIQVVQGNEDDLGNVTDEFQENFFEALKQKAIENYEKAIVALQKCEKLQPENPVVPFEMGKNYKLLENYEAAISSLQKANRLKPNQQWVLAELMESFYENKDYEEAIIIAKNLVPIDAGYYNNLADLYFKTQKFDELLQLLDRLDAELGVDEFRLGLRQQIFAITNNTPARIDVVKQAIKANPEDQANYLNLIYIYSEEGMEAEAFSAAEDMKIKFPNSRIVHLALYKFYLNDNKPEKALESMKIILAAEEIDAESKFKVLNDFLLFAAPRPEYQDDLNEVIALFSTSENSPQIYQKLGEYFLIKNEKEQALSYFEQGLTKDLDNFELIRNTLLLQLDLGRFQEASVLSEKALEIFPAQPVLYLVRGAALNQQQEFKEAEEALTFGLDYVIDNENMEVDFFEQLSITYLGLGNEKKSSEFLQRAKEKNNKLK
ncbi:hypothetical protein LZ575_15330 [Antarcticibacterium sp. 1MA-6-2]|uniref:tetratricopeptide repeat protein n=1 Tax=Antarcticibacterium sp. 1MA-6-2 TaxID=2908210 RepID=UPI001F227B9E|nr:hypothetical protein [Antarcticibacterium sp. 1MA-6-2]UJH90240.1 hypothetical protein LZ575_15330 [Antarcticibacterium sp. 1MA-6-2]